METHTLNVDKKLTQMDAYREHVNVIHDNVESLQAQVTDTLIEIKELTD